MGGRGEVVPNLGALTGPGHGVHTGCGEALEAGAGQGPCLKGKS